MDYQACYFLIIDGLGAFNEIQGSNSEFIFLPKINVNLLITINVVGATQVVSVGCIISC